MAGSSFGNQFKITTWGESHGKGLGVVVDGCPAGLSIEEETIQQYLNRRSPGNSVYGTPRKETDRVTILSGIMEGKTTGTPISMMVMNESQRSSDYSELASCYRPGHADYTFDMKYGIRDYRGGGRSSGRETIGRVAAGGIALSILKEMGIEVTAYTKSIGTIQVDYTRCKKENIEKSPFYMPDLEASLAAEEYVKQMMEQKDSIGGVVECIISGMPAGVGEPVFEKLDANLGKAILSIGAVKGFEIGAGFRASEMTGLQNNDSFIKTGKETVSKASNNAGGILGGISDGTEIVFRGAFKPTPSIGITQKTLTKSLEETEINIKGRHDPIIVPRAVVVVESMAALTLVDMLFENMTSKMQYIKNFYKN
ncbi:MAG: chorismate synthase [Acetivibrio sp.]